MKPAYLHRRPEPVPVLTPSADLDQALLHRSSALDYFGIQHHRLQIQHMESNQPDPLDRLFGNRSVVNRQLLAEALIELVWLDREGMSFHFHPGVRDRLGRLRSVVAALLAQKALALATGADDENLTPRAIETRTGFKGGTIRPVLQELLARGLIVKKDGKYGIPDAALETATRALQ